MKNIKTILDTIKQYLLSNNVEMDNTILLAIKKRKNGKNFSFDEHISAMFYALISGGAKWNIILSNKKYIDESFFFFNKTKLLDQFKTNDKYFYDRFEHNKCGIRFLDRSIKALYYNINVFERIKNQYGNLENYINKKLPYEILKELSTGKFKLYAMKQTLIAEYMRNVGIDFSKPDTHIMRILGKDCLNYIEDDSPIETIKFIEKISHATNYSQAEIDSLLWHFCAYNYGEICTSNNPKCNICPINKYCNKGNAVVATKQNIKKIFIKKQNNVISTNKRKTCKDNRNSDIEDAYRNVIDRFTTGKIYKRKEIENIVNSVYHTEGSILPSDYCYNRINLDIVDDFEKRMHIFEYLKRNAYRFIGENVPYTGNIVHVDICVSRWENGRIVYLDKNKVMINSINK